MTKCNDTHCPTHGQQKTSMRTYTGIVESDKMRRTISIKREKRIMLKKYERYAKRYSTLKAHNPDCISAKTGDQVVVAECKPISKSKHFVVIEKKSR